MNAIIYFTMSKNKRSKAITKDFEGDVYEIRKTSLSIKWYPLQLLVFGFLANIHVRVSYSAPSVDFDSYDHLILITPVWSGKISAYMRQYLQDYRFSNKKVTLVASSDGGHKNIFRSYQTYLDPSNDIIDQIVYVKGERQGE